MKIALKKIQFRGEEVSFFLFPDDPKISEYLDDFEDFLTLWKRREVDGKLPAELDIKTLKLRFSLLIIFSSCNFLFNQGTHSAPISDVKKKKPGGRLW